MVDIRTSKAGNYFSACRMLSSWMWCHIIWYK